MSLTVIEKLIAIIYFPLVFFSCGNHIEQSNLSEIHGEWQLTKFHNYNIELDTLRIPFLGIDTMRMKIYGYDSCNSIFGDLLNKNHQIEIDRIGRTLRACIGNQFYDDQFVKSLKEARIFNIKGVNLFLLTKNKKILLEFERLVRKE